jgi:hypothetical protein
MHQAKPYISGKYKYRKANKKENEFIWHFVPLEQGGG